MKKARVGLVTGLAITALAAVGAAPASAQVDTSPPCTPGIPVPDAVNCTFEIAVWAVGEVQKVPGTVLTEAQRIANEAIADAQDLFSETGQTVDELERTVIDTACYAALDLEPGSCPSE